MPATKAHSGILTHDLEAVRARLAGAGIEGRPDDRFPAFFVDGCFGSRL